MRGNLCIESSNVLTEDAVNYTEILMSVAWDMSWELSTIISPLLQCNVPCLFPFKLHTTSSKEVQEYATVNKTIVKGHWNDNDDGDDDEGDGNSEDDV